MTSTPKQMASSHFKARCLALLDEVAATGVEIVVTKRGNPVAKLVPLTTVEPASLLGSVRYADESALLEPVDEAWDADA